MLDVFMYNVMVRYLVYALIVGGYFFGNIPAVQRLQWDHYHYYSSLLAIIKEILYIFKEKSLNSGDFYLMKRVIVIGGQLLAHALRKNYKVCSDPVIQRILRITCNLKNHHRAKHIKIQVLHKRYLPHAAIIRIRRNTEHN